MSTSSTSTNSNQQTLADSGANERPPMLEKGNYIPWESQFRRFLDNKLEDGERMWNSIQNGPYQRPMVVDPIHPTVPMLEPLSKMTKGNKKQYIADVRVMNYLLQAIPNDIYNSVDACKDAKEMWERIKRLMHGSEITTHVRHSRLMDEFDKFAAKEGESLDSVHERLTTLVNIMDRNNVRLIPVAINIKFLNCLQPEWSKYVTMVRHNQTGPAVSYDVLYDQLVQFEPHVLASRAKKAAKNHDPLALIAHSNASSSHSHANSSYTTQPYYDGRVDIQTKNASYGGNANKNAGRNRTQGFNAGDESNQIIQRVSRTESTPGKVNVQEQMLLAMKDEAGSNLSNEENDFMLDTSYGEELEELTAVVHASSKVHEQLEKKAFKEREDRYLDDIIDFEEKLSSHDRIVYEMGQSIQTINMLGKKPNKVYDHFLKAGLGYTNPKRSKKDIVAQPKMYDGDLLHSNKLVIYSIDSEETLEDAEESRNKMRHKMVQIYYEKLNAFYETFVPQQELSAEQTYFLIPSTSDNGSKSKDVPSESPGLKMSIESRLLKMIDTLGDTIIGFQTRINKTFLQDKERRWLSDSQNELREFYKTNVIPMSVSLYKTLSEIKEELIEEVQEMLNIFVTMEQQVNEKSPTETLLQNEIDRLLKVSLTSEIRDCVLLSVEQQKHELL
ncbi:hypothetical protein Tco_0135299 [Tanacetum coccineum]